MANDSNAPTLDDINQAIAAKSSPSLEDINNAIAAKQGEGGIGHRILGGISTGAKALDSVTGAPFRAGISAAQNGNNPFSAFGKQFANMTDQAPSGSDIAAKAGFSTDETKPYIYPAPGNVSQDQLPQPRSAATAAGFGLDMAANPLNFAGPVVRGAGKAAEFLSPAADALEVASKPNAEAITTAASRLGFKPTSGMLSDSPTVQGLESTLSQSPTIPGAVVRSSMKPVHNALQNAAEDLVSGAPSEGTSSYQAGNSASSGITAQLGQKVNNVQMAYEPFNQELPKMIPEKIDRYELADKIAKIGDQHLDPNEVQGLIKGTTNKIVNSENLSDIEEIRKQLGQKITTAISSNDGALADTLTKIKDKISNFRDDQFQKLAQQAYPGPNGAVIGQQMVSQYKNAMSMHQGLMNDLRDVGPLFGIKAKNPRDFIESFSEIPPEQVAQKLFKTNNVQALQKVQQYFPDEFETIKNLKLQDLRNSSLSNPIDPSNSPVDPTKLITKINKLTPEVQSVLFGDKAQKVKDMQTVLGSFPEKIGPSGTPKGEMFTHMGDWLQQARDVGGYATYKTLGSKAVNSLSKIPQNISSAAESLQNVPNAAGPASNVVSMGVRPAVQAVSNAAQNQNPTPQGAPMPMVPQQPPPQQPMPAQNQMPQAPAKPVDPKGPDKWAGDGLQNLKGHVDDENRQWLEENKGALLLDPKTKQLLITASNFKPGSKPLDDIVKHIKNRLGEK